MLNNNYTNQNFWKETRYVFMGGAPSAQPEALQAFEKTEKVDEVKKDVEPLDLSHFNEARSKIKNVIDAIGKSAKDIPAKHKIKLQNSIINNATKRLQGLRNQYISTVDKIGRHDPKVEQIENQFKEKADQFAQKIENKYGKGDNKTESEVRYFSQKEGMAEAKDSKGEHKIKTEIITNFLKQKGIGQEMINAMAPYIAKRIGSLKSFDSAVMMKKHVENMLSSDEKVMERALNDLIADSPLIKAEGNEVTFIKNHLWNSDLVKNFGKNNLDKAATHMARQLHIVFDKKGNPIGYADMLGDKSLKKADKGELQAKIKELALKYKNGKELDEYGKSMDKAEEGQTEALVILREGARKWYKLGARGGSEKVDEMADLKQNEHLSKWISNTKEFRTTLAAIKPFEDHPDFQRLIAKNKKVGEIASAATEKGYSGHPLLELLKLLQELIGKGRGDKLNDVKDGVEKDEDVVSKYKKKAQENYERILNSGKPNLSNLLSFHSKPESEEAKKYFQDKAKELAGDDKDAQEKAMKDADMYPELRKEAIKKYANKMLGGNVKSIESEGDKTVITATVDGATITISGQKDKWEIQKGDEKIAFNGDMSKFKDNLGKLNTQITKAKEQKEKDDEERVKSLYKNKLESLSKAKNLGKKVSELGGLIKLVPGLGDKYPKWASTKGRPAKRQKQLDDARAKFIMDNFKFYKPLLDKQEKFANLIKEPEAEKKS